MPFFARWGHLQLLIPPSVLNFKAPDGVCSSSSQAHLSVTAEVPRLVVQTIMGQESGSPTDPCISLGHTEADPEAARPGLPTCILDSSTPASPRAHQA